MNMHEKDKDEKAKRISFLEMLINVVTAGMSGHITSRAYLTEIEEKILRKRWRERNKSQREHELDMAK